MQRRRREYRAPNVDSLPDVSAKVDPQVASRLKLAWPGLTNFTVAHLDDHKRQMQVGSNEFDSKPGDPPTADGEPIDQTDVLQQVYGFVSYYADRELEGPATFFVKFWYRDDDGERRYRSTEFGFTPEGCDDGGDEGDTPDLVQAVPFALNQAQPVVEAILRPMLKALDERERALVKRIEEQNVSFENREKEFFVIRAKHFEQLVQDAQSNSGFVIKKLEQIITIQNDAIRQCLDHVKSADERMYRVNKAMIGGRESEPDAHQQTTSGSRYPDPFEQLRKDRDRRADLIAQFGPVVSEFLPSLLQNITDAIVEARKGITRVPATPSPAGDESVPEEPAPDAG